MPGRQRRVLSSPARGDGVWSSRCGLWTGGEPFPPQQVSTTARWWEDGWTAHSTGLEDVGAFPFVFPHCCLPSTCRAHPTFPPRITEVGKELQDHRVQPVTNPLLGPSTENSVPPWLSLDTSQLGTPNLPGQSFNA